MSLNKKCEFNHCQSISNKLFQAPTNYDQLLKWKRLLGTTKNDFSLCEIHFENKFVEYEKVLKKNAIPTLQMNESEKIQETFCECCYAPIYKDDRRLYIESVHREIYKLIFNNFDLNYGFICSRCNDQLTNIHHFKAEVEERQRDYKSFDNFEPKVKIELEEPNYTVFEEPSLNSSSSTHFVQIKTECEDDYENDIKNRNHLEYSKKLKCKSETKTKRKTKTTVRKGTKKSSFLYQCDFCKSFTADNKADYSDHIKAFHAINESRVESKSNESISLPIIKESIALEDKHPVQCDYCSKIFKSKKILIQHIRSHISISAENEIKCTECSKIFKSIQLMSRHRNFQHGDGKKFWCMCNKVYDNKRDIIKCRLSHPKRSTSGDESTCDECNKSFKSSRQLLGHKNKYHGNGTRFWCVRCGEMYDSKEGQTNCVKSHYNDSLKDVLVECPECGKQMLHNSMKVHLKSTHSTVREVICHLCGKGFSTVSRLTIHTRQVHSNQRPYICDHCPLRTALKKAMKDHLLKRHATHRKTYQCPICFKVTYEVLDRHMNQVHPNGYDNGVRVNSETNMYHCPRCVQQFGQMKRYVSHVNENICENYGDYEVEHEDGKFSVFTKGKFKCKICDSIQTSLSRLRRHMNYIHSGEQNCPICDKRMKSKRSVISHLRKVHKTNYTAATTSASS